MPPLYEISDAAYTTALLHAAKHATTPVLGILLGRASKTAIQLTRAMPLCHSDLSFHTTPLAETFLHLLEAHTHAQSENTADQLHDQVIGLYFANALPSDMGIGIIPTQIGERIRQTFSDTCVLQIDARLLKPETRAKQHCMRIAVKTAAAGTWTQAILQPIALVVSETALRKVDGFLSERLELPIDITVADFEDHCQNPRSDMFNGRLIAHLQSLTI